MKATEVKSMPVEELNAKLDSLKEELFALRFQLAADIACVKTAIRSAELSAQQ